MSEETNNNNETAVIEQIAPQNLGTLSLNSLREVMETNNCIKRIITKLVKNTEEITISDLLALISNTENLFTRWDVIKSVKTLQNLGYLKFISGRKGFLSRVFFFVSTRELNKLIKENGTEIQIQSNKYNTQSVKTKRETGISKRYSFMLRPDYRVNITLPREIQTNEIGKLTQYLTSIAIPEKVIV